MQVTVGGASSCTNGGHLIEVGSDVDANGTIEPLEVSSSFEVCNGRDGLNGQDGQAGEDGKAALIRTTNDGAIMCAAGGNLLEVGLDDDGDGILDDAEVDSSFEVCFGFAGSSGQNGRDGADGANSLLKVTIEPPGNNCQNGGQKIEVGSDSNYNGTLDATEIVASQTAYICQPEPVEFVQVSAGSMHTCAVTVDGAAKCWGSNYFGQLGDGSTNNSSTPVDVSGLGGGVVSISAGLRHTCAVTTLGTAKCWGYNYHGQLGNGGTHDSNTPVNVGNLSGVASISAGSGHTCVVTTSGVAKCWGGNAHGQLGNGGYTKFSTPVDVSGSNNMVSISAGSSHTCAITALGAAKCWGAGSKGQLGTGSYMSAPTPMDVSGLGSGVASISAGGRHTCAVTTRGVAKCWGYNDRGQLGNGGTTNSNIPVDVSIGMASISASSSHTCAVTTGGAVNCWGSGSGGRLGDGGTDNSYIPRSPYGLRRGARVVSTRSDHTCAVTTLGAVKCWGRGNNGQLGDGIDSDSHVPVDVLVD